MVSSDVLGCVEGEENILPLSNQQKEHAHLSPISLVTLAMQAYQITLLESQGEKNVGGCRRGEEAASDGLICETSYVHELGTTVTDLRSDSLLA